VFHWRGQLTALIGQQGATTLAGQVCVCECVCERVCFIGEGSSLHVLGSRERPHWRDKFVCVNVCVNVRVSLERAAHCTYWAAGSDHSGGTTLCVRMCVWTCVFHWRGQLTARNGQWGAASATWINHTGGTSVSVWVRVWVYVCGCEW